MNYPYERSSVGPEAEPQRNVPSFTVSELDVEIAALPMGEYIIMRDLGVKQVALVMGHITLWYQGVVKEHDERIGAAPHITPEWDWRIQETIRQDPDTRRYTLWLQKVPTPPQQRSTRYLKAKRDVEIGGVFYREGEIVELLADEASALYRVRNSPFEWVGE